MRLVKVLVIAIAAALVAAPVASAGKHRDRDADRKERGAVAEVVDGVLDVVAGTTAQATGDDGRDAGERGDGESADGNERGSDANATPRPQLGGKKNGGIDCRLIAVPTAAPVGAGTCPGVRPGALVETDVGFCTMNFLFKGKGGARYIGTAGHCILGDGPTDFNGGEHVWKNKGPVARDGQGNRIGQFAYAILDGQRDFALIRLDKGVDADAAMCHFGGPTGINDQRSGSPVVLRHFGQGLLVGETIPARTEVAPNTLDRNEVYAFGVALPGDSGAGVEDAGGRAFGVLVTLGVGVDGVIGITRLAPQLERARQQLGTKLKLVQARNR